MKYTKSGTVTASLCDAVPQLSVVSSFQLAEDMVTELMGSLKIDGLTVMQEYNALWVFTRNYLRFLTPLPWNAPYTASSYITPHSPVRLLIETVFRNGDGEIAFTSELEMCAVDMETQRIRRLSSVGVDPSFTEESVLTQSSPRDKSPSDCVPVDTVTVRASDIDYAHHTNNISYIRYLLNTYTVKELVECPFTAADIHYKGQTYEGDVLQIRKASLSGHDFFRIESGGKDVAECSFCRQKG